jgi:hypothetical protein
MDLWRLKPLGLAMLLLAALAMAGCRGGEDDGAETPARVFELVYATYWGGSPQANKGNAIAVDSEGRIVLAGETQCPSFFLQNPIVDATRSTTGFVSAFSADGQSVVYSTLLGDPDGYNFCLDLAVDGQGSAVAGGMAGGQNFPLQDPLYPTFGEPWQCGFLSSIVPTGGALNFSTFIPQQRVVALALDRGGNVYLATMDNSLLKVSADGRRLLYECRLLAGMEDTAVEDIVVAADGSLAVAGWTADWGFPSLNPVQAGRGGLTDAFILVLDPQGSALRFASRLGGSQDDFADGVAVAGDGSIFACGSTASADFPLKNPADPSLGGGVDAFAVRIDPTAGTLLYSTFVGGGGEDKAKAVALGAGGEAYLCGWTTSADFPVRGAVSSRLGGAKDAFVAKLSADGGSLLLSTYVGGAVSAPQVGGDGRGADWANDLCLGPDGKIYITGETYASDLPLRNPLDDANSFSKAFIAVLRENRP